jgi:lipoate---protein ligase
MPSRPSWRLISEEKNEPLCNLTREEAIARSNPSTPALLLWRDSSCVVLGRFQLSAAEVDQFTCESEGVSVYRRFTGGGAVYHDLGNLNVSLVLPRKLGPLVDDPNLTRLPQAYSLVLEPLAHALRMMGLRPIVGTREITIGGHKVSGVAAWFGVGSVLVHATLLVNSDLELLNRVLNGPGAPGNSRWERTKSRRASVTSLAREGIRDLCAEVVREAVTSAFADHFGCVLERADLTTKEQELAAELFATRYSLRRWHVEG